MSSFTVGDEVTWKSQFKGSWATKQGVVAEVVPPGRRPHPQRDATMHAMFGGPVRDHESYVVVAPSKSGRGQPRAYWPVVSWLRLATTMMERTLPERCCHNNCPTTCELCFAALRKVHAELLGMAADMANILADEVHAEWGGTARCESIQDRILAAGLLRARSADEIDACYVNEEVYCVCRDNAHRDDVDSCYTFSDAMKELLK